MDFQVPPEKQIKDETTWASPVDKLQAPETPKGMVNLNVEGRTLSGPMQGFGQMWQKDYWIRLSGIQVTPPELIRIWKDKFPTFWPKGNKFFGSTPSIKPGEVAVLNLGAPVGPSVISTGIMVIYSDDLSFTFMTPEGHMFAGMITFYATRDHETTVANIRALVRASDPIYEFVTRIAGSQMEDLFWQSTLAELGRYFGVLGQASMTSRCIDPRVQWGQTKKVFQNAGIRTVVYHLWAPVRWTQRLVAGK